MVDILDMTKSDVDDIKREDLSDYLTREMKFRVRTKLGISSMTMQRALSKHESMYKRVNKSLMKYIIINAKAEIKKFIPDTEEDKDGIGKRKIFNLTD